MDKYTYLKESMEQIPLQYRQRYYIEKEHKSFPVIYLDSTCPCISVNINGEIYHVNKKMFNWNLLDNCIGLLDVDNTPIYDKDIIVIPNQYPFYDYAVTAKPHPDLNETQGEILHDAVLNYIGIVENIHNCWQYVLHCVNSEKNGISNGINYLINDVGWESTSDFKIIGNIRENEELLRLK